MKIALVGYGKMGHVIEAVAAEQDTIIVSKYDIHSPLAANPDVRKDLEAVDVVFDFSESGAVLQTIAACASIGKSMVVGTTGWFEHLQEAKRLVEKAGIGFVYASNFSLGVNLFYKITAYSASLMKSFEEYDPFLEEAHHKFKKDAPSGTALKMQSILESEFGRKIPVSSTRAGYIPGMHVLGFDSKVDTILLSHTARSREGLARGALMAARWLAGKKGFFSFENVLDDMLPTSR